MRFTDENYGRIFDDVFTKLSGFNESLIGIGRALTW